MKKRKKIINKFVNIFSQNEMRILPGNLAYSFFLAMIPLLTLLFYLLTSFNLPMDIINNFINTTFPSGVVKLIEPVLASDLSINSLITLIIGFIVAMNGCNAIIVTSNTIYNIPNKGFFGRITKSIILLLCILLLLIFIVIVPLLGKGIINLVLIAIPSFESYRESIFAIYNVVKVPLSLLIIYVLIKIIYRVAPDEEISSKYVIKGSVFTTVMWTIATYIYSYYINNIANYSLVYGNLANIIILLFWFLVLSYIFVIGLFLNKDTTEKEIAKTNAIKLEEIREKIKENNRKK